MGMCRPGGYSHVKAYGDMGPILVKKSLEEGPISQKLRKMLKSVIFVEEKPLEMGPVDLQKYCKKQNKTKQNTKQNKTKQNKTKT